SDKEAHDQGFGLRLSSAADLSGIMFPYIDPATGHMVGARLRRDNPEQEQNGKPKNKYIFTYGDRQHLYFPPRSKDLLSDTSVPVILVEAEKSSLSLLTLSQISGRRLLPIATGGCWGWWGRIGKQIQPNGGSSEEIGPIADLTKIAWTERDV